VFGTLICTWSVKLKVVEEDYVVVWMKALGMTTYGVLYIYIYIYAHLTFYVK